MKMKLTIRQRIQFAALMLAARALAFVQVWRVKLQWPGCEGATNTFPTTGAGSLATGYLASGVTTIRFGTEGLLQSPKPAGYYTVLRFNEQTLVTQQKLPNGNAITSTRILLVDGQKWDLTVRDDTQMTPPQVGDSVTLVDAGGLVAGTTAGAITTYVATVCESGWETSPGQAGERILSCENLLLVDSQTPGTQS